MSIEKNTPNLLKHEASPFTTILNEVIQNIRNPLALGIYCYLASQYEGWDISVKHLMNHFDCGRDKIKGGLTFLKNLGLYEVTAIKGKDGRVIKWQTLLRRTIHITENPSSGDSSTLLKNHILDNPASGKTAPINKEDKEIKEKRRNEVVQIVKNDENLDFDDDFSGLVRESAAMASFLASKTITRQLSEGVDLTQVVPDRYSPFSVTEAARSDEKLFKLYHDKKLHLVRTFEEEIHHCLEYYRLRNKPAGIGEFRAWVMNAHIVKPPKAPEIRQPREDVLSDEQRDMLNNYYHCLRLGSPEKMIEGFFGGIDGYNKAHEFAESLKNKGGVHDTNTG